MTQTDLRMTASPSRMTGMKFRQALGEVIRAERLANGLTLRDVSRRGFVSLGHLSEVERGENDPSSECLDGIANGLGVKVSSLIVKAGDLMTEWEIPDTPESLFAPTHHSHSRQ